MQLSLVGRPGLLTTMNIRVALITQRDLGLKHAVHYKADNLGNVVNPFLVLDKRPCDINYTIEILRQL